MVISILFLPPFLEYLLINCLFFLPVFLLLCWVLLQQDSQVTSHRYWVCWYRFFLFCGTHLQPKMICFHLFFFTNSSILSLSLSLSPLSSQHLNRHQGLAIRGNWLAETRPFPTPSPLLPPQLLNHPYCHSPSSTSWTPLPAPSPRESRSRCLPPLPLHARCAWVLPRLMLLCWLAGKLAVVALFLWNKCLVKS